MQSALSDQAQSCSDQGNQYPFCSPVSTDVWTNGSTYDFVWNFNYPFYVGYESISLYLYYYIKFEYQNVKNFTNLDRSTGGIEVTVDDSWFLTPLNPGDSPKNWTMLGFYLPSTLNSAEELASPTSMFPRPFNFTITQIAPPGNSTTNIANTTNSTSTNNNNSNDKNNGSNSNSLSSSSALPGWAIAIIVIAVIALVCGAAALIWAILISRRNKRNNKLIPIAGGKGGRKGDSSKGSSGEKGLYKDSASINSQAKINAFRSTDSVPMSAAENASSVGTLASRQTYTQPFTPYDNKLSSTDAVLLADTFRNTLGRSTADWNPAASGAYDEQEEEELKRRRLGEALLQRQLEEDGTSVKHAGRFTRVKSLADIQKSAVFEHPTKY
ncbi:unnamed protein product [Mucor circinelloides]|uniref:Uncharacterized protein n=1 Tax=Mucor circinelloides f. circinelloides (strain 1006PhL) TaxID=1220926 RepID=S2JGV4_MUCC1|nr:hypothetical protein HMPREF1544_05397 [Mucor circinelloides 1006PhL]